MLVDGESFLWQRHSSACFDLLIAPTVGNKFSLERKENHFGSKGPMRVGSLNHLPPDLSL